MSPKTAIASLTLLSLTACSGGQVVASPEQFVLADAILAEKTVLADEIDKARAGELDFGPYDRDTVYDLDRMPLDIKWNAVIDRLDVCQTYHAGGDTQRFARARMHYRDRNDQDRDDFILALREYAEALGVEPEAILPVAATAEGSEQQDIPSTAQLLLDTYNARSSALQAAINELQELEEAKFREWGLRPKSSYSSGYCAGFVQQVENYRYEL